MDTTPKLDPFEDPTFPQGWVVFGIMPLMFVVVVSSGGGADYSLLVAAGRILVATKTRRLLAREAE